MKVEVSQVDFLGLPFDNLTQSEALKRIIALSRGPDFSYIVTPNVDHIVRLHAADSGGELWDAYSAASLRLCDSRVLGRLARFSGLELIVVPGSDLTAAFAQVAEQCSGVAVVGGDAKLRLELARRYPALRWYQHIPPMGVRHDEQAQSGVIKFVEGCQADVFLFAIGSPQSESLCARISRRGRAHGAALCVGASLEFLTGAKQRAPLWMQLACLEWLFRLITEPRRLWRRYLVDGPRIFSIWLRWHFNRARQGDECDSRSTDEK